MVLFNCVDCRLYPDSFINFIRKLLPANSAEDLLQLFFRKGMGNDFHGKILKICLALSFFLPARDLDHILFGRFDNIKCLCQSFRFVKDELQFQLSGDHIQLFGRAPITVIVCRRDLRGKAFHVCIQPGQLVLHGQDHCHECFPAETIQFFR